MWFIGVEVEQETSAPPPEKNPGSATEARTVKRKQNGLIKGSQSTKKWLQDYGFEELTSLQQVTNTTG